MQSKFHPSNNENVEASTSGSWEGSSAVREGVAIGRAEGIDTDALSKGLGGGSMAWFSNEAADYCAPC